MHSAPTHTYALSGILNVGVDGSLSLSFQFFSDCLEDRKNAAASFKLRKGSCAQRSQGRCRRPHTVQRCSISEGMLFLSCMLSRTANFAAELR